MMATMARTRSPAALATPEDVSRAEASVAPQRQALQQFQSEESRLMGDVRTAEEAALKAKEDRDIAVKEAEATQLGLSAEQQRGLTEKAQREIEKNPFPTFKPSQEDAVSYSQLGSLVGTLGMMLGGGAKGSAKVAIGAMTGMMKGWQAGRKDLWDREVKVFDKEVQRIKAVHDSIYKDLDMGLKQLATDREAGRAKLMSAAWKAGTGSVIATLINNGRAQDALKIVRDGYKLSSDIDKRVQDIAIAQRRHQDQIAAQAAQRAAMIEAARIRSGGDDLKRQLTEARIREVNARIDRANKKAEDAGKNEKPPAKEIVAQNTLRNNLIPKLESAIPVLDRLHQEGKWGKLTTFLAADPRAAELAFKNDPEALNLILTLAYFRSKEFETAGKALTKKEDQILAPIVRGDLRVYQGIRNAMVDAQKTLTLEQKGLENAYPYIRKVNDAFRKEITGVSEDKFEVGKTYTDSDGNKAKYLGNGQWEEQ
jgi:uncharacterized protein YcfJ